MNIFSKFPKMDIYHVAIIILLIINIIISLYCCRCTNAANKEMFSGTPKVMQNYGDEIVLYYASWCGYSRTFLPEWEKFSSWAAANAKKLKVTSIRCESGNEETCIEKGIRGYPTVVFYPKEGTEKVFNGERTAETLTDFIKKELNM
jgi:thiol-disulfide isomerase/thioredoxin